MNDLGSFQPNPCTSFLWVEEPLGGVWEGGGHGGQRLAGPDSIWLESPDSLGPEKVRRGVPSILRPCPSCWIVAQSTFAFEHALPASSSELPLALASYPRSSFQPIPFLVKWHKSISIACNHQPWFVQTLKSFLTQIKTHFDAKCPQPWSTHTLLKSCLGGTWLAQWSRRLWISGLWVWTPHWV